MDTSTSAIRGRQVRARDMSLNEYAGRKVLVVDDEPVVREVVAAYLSRDGFVVTEAADGRGALLQISETDPDLIVLDVMLPESDGLSVLSMVRDGADTPVILLSARGDESDRVLGLEMGADDYVVKPFSPRELATRVRTILKRVDKPRRAGSPLEFRDLMIDPASHEIRVHGRTVDITPKEFELLLFLASSPRQVFSRGQILAHVWDSNNDWQDPSTVTVHVRRLRQKIEDDPRQPRRLVTVWGVGYRFEP
jgi:two-component system, OmpR family, phosphate regulon response regulator PhoB